LRQTVIGPDEVPLPKPPGDNRQGHRQDFLRCVKTREQPIAPAEVGHRSVTVAHLGNIAMLLGRKIRWDPRREQVLGDEAASRMLGRALRSGWRL